MRGKRREMLNMRRKLHNQIKIIDKGVRGNRGGVERRKSNVRKNKRMNMRENCITREENGKRSRGRHKLRKNYITRQL